MKNMVVLAKRDFQVRTKSVLNETNLARKTATSTASAPWQAFENTAEFEAAVSAEDRLKMANEAAEMKAKSEAKTTSPWSDIEIMVEKVSKGKKITPQEALEMLLGYELVTIPAFTESDSTEENDDDEAEEETTTEVV